MSSANNIIGNVPAYTPKSAAVNVSRVANKSRQSGKTAQGFENILSKVSENLSRKTTPGQETTVKESRNELRNNPYKTDRNVQTSQKLTTERSRENESDIDKMESQSTNGYIETDNELLSQIAAFLNQNGNDAGALQSLLNPESLGEMENIEINGTIISKDDLLSLLGGQLPQTGVDIPANLREILATDFNTMSAELNKAIIGGGLQLFNNVAGELNVPAEDIMNAMQTLGLMAMDLLNPQNMQQLVTKLSGGEQGIDLITDSDIYTSLQDLMEGAESMNSELMNEFDLSEEGLQSAIADSKEQFANLMQQNQAEGSQDNTQADQATLEEILKARENLEQSEKNKVRQLLNGEEAPGSEAFKDFVSNDKSEDVLSKALLKDNNNSQNFGNGAESSNLFNQLMNRIADAAIQTRDPEQVSYTDRAQMQDIIRQITDRITISAGPEETSMELALHPASLGNVNILLTSGKDGIVAKFTAQNQLVKEAVETQMVQLQQKFDEQGIKVTSIEVTIASHGFEQNLDQEGGRGSRNTGDEKRVKPLRRINLSEIDDEIAMEMNSDAEKIAMQMMAANGNSVDFSA